MASLATLLWTTVVILHIGVPLSYLLFMRRYGSRRSYGVKIAHAEQPTVTLLIPTYNEAAVIKGKLLNISQIDYRREKLEIIVVDSGSTDGTADLAGEVLKTANLKGMVLKEPERSGKSSGLNLGLKFATGDLVCISDAECRWERAALRNAATYLTDPSVGSVSGIHNNPKTESTLSANVESSYRSMYRILRIAESKIHSTPIAEGEIQLFRRGQFTGFDPNVGGDDTCAALCMVEKGYRAINAEDVFFYEPVPLNWKAGFRQKIRRGQHILQAFLKHRGIVQGKSIFSRVIFPMEFFLYVVNPLFFPPFLALTLWLLVSYPPAAYVAAVGAVILLGNRTLRQLTATYLANNLTMLGAVIQEIRGNKQLTWTKIQENRREIGATLGSK